MISSGTSSMSTCCFEKCPTTLLITFLQYLTINEMDALSRTTTALVKRLLGQGPFEHVLFEKNISTIRLFPCYSSISCIAHVLLFRHSEASPITYYEFKKLQSALSILSKQDSEYKKHNKTILHHFCSKIKHLNLRVSANTDDRWPLSYISPMTIQAGTTYTCNESIVKLIEKFPNAQTVHLTLCCQRPGPSGFIEHGSYHLFQGEELSSLRNSAIDYWHAVRINRIKQRHQRNSQEREQPVLQHHEEREEEEKISQVLVPVPIPPSKKQISGCQVS